MKTPRIIQWSLVLVGIFITYFLLVYKERRDREIIGERLIEKIESYRNTNKRLPNTVRELGIEEEIDEGPYYEKNNSQNYKVYFEIGFDHDRLTYYSRTKEWKYGR